MVPNSPSNPADPRIEALLEFWFSPPVRPLWFQSTAEFDDELRDRYLGLYQEAASGRLEAWEASPEGALALVILLDQLPLNMFRDRPEAFETEALSRRVAERALERGFDRSLSGARLSFLFMPFMHSEDLDDQDRSVALFERAELKDNLRWARHHREIVRRFGRFPHRNGILGRESTPEELAWLASDEAFKG